MAFPSDGGSTRSLADLWRQVRGYAGAVKSRAQALRNQAAAGPVSAMQMLDLTTVLADAKVQFQSAAAVSGLAEYAQQQVGNPALDVVAEFNAMMAQIDATILWIRTNLPNDGTYLLALTLGTDGRYSWRTFAPAATAGLRTQLDALIATID